MSIAQVETALTNFAVNNTGSAIVLKGEWGTGKTYIWDKVIKNHRKSFIRKRYSRVSLFGINSLTDLKRSIFENSVSSEKAGSATTKESVLENVKKLKFINPRSWWRKLFSQAKEAKLPIVGGFGGLIDSVQYAMVKDTIVCIDDFERRGNALSSRDVLGLISNLVESKECSVILILNEASLEKADEFFTFSEKVFDYEVMYAPTLDEAASVVFNSTDAYEKKIVVNTKKLKINNIRLLRKIKYFADLIKPYVDGKPDEILEESTKLVPLAIYAKYSGSEKIFDIDDLENFKGGLSLFPSEKKDLTDEQKTVETKKVARTNFFHEYGYREADDFTIEIIKLIKNGYADAESLMPLIDSVTVVVEKNNRRQIISEAWNVFHHDFSLPDLELLNLFEDAVTKCSDVISPYEIEGILELFTAAGLEKRGKLIVDKYFESLKLNRFISRRSEMLKLPKNTYVTGKLDEYFTGIATVWGTEELIDEFVDRPTSGEVLELLSALTVDQLYGYFKQLDSDKFVSYAESLLALGSRTGMPDSADYCANIFLNVFEALKRMHSESPLMAMRMNKFMDYKESYDQKKKLRE